MSGACNKIIRRGGLYGHSYYFCNIIAADYSAVNGFVRDYMQYLSRYDTDMAVARASVCR